MQSRNQIDDKYTRGGFVEGIKGLYSDFMFSYRPMLPEEVEDLLAALDRTKPGRAAIAVVSDTIAKKITEWSEVDAKGKPVEIKGRTLANLPFALLGRVRGIVEGRQATDLPAGADESTLAEFVAAKLAEGRCEAPGLKQLENDQKN